MTNGLGAVLSHQHLAQAMEGMSFAAHHAMHGNGGGSPPPPMMERSPSMAVAARATAAAVNSLHGPLRAVLDIPN